MDKKTKNGLLIAGAGAGLFILYQLYSKKSAAPAYPVQAAPVPSSQTSTTSIISSAFNAITNWLNPAPAQVVADQQIQISLPTSQQPVSNASPAADAGQLQTTAPLLTLSPSVMPDPTASAAVMPPDYVAGIIGTTAETGKIISSVSPALAAVPVVGWIAAGVGEVVGAALQIFGNKWHENTDVRWLTATYEKYVLGIPGISDNKISENQIQPSISWFTLVTGVPILTQSQFQALAGRDTRTGKTIPNLSMDQRIARYLTTPGASKVTYQEAYSAAQIMDNSMPYWDNKGNVIPGSWKGLVAAPSTIDYSMSGLANAAGATSGMGALSSLSVSPSGSLVSNPAGTVQAVTPAASSLLSGNTPLYLLAGGALLLLATSGKKKDKKVSGITENGLLIGGLALGGYYLYQKNKTASIPPVPTNNIDAATLLTGSVPTPPIPLTTTNPFKNFTGTYPSLVKPVSASIAGIGSIGAIETMAAAGAMAGISGFDFSAIKWEQLLVPAVLIGGGYLVYKKIFGGSSGTPSPQTSQNNATIIANQSNVDSTITAQQNAGAIQTLTDAQAAGIANSIWAIGSGSSLSISEQDQIRYLVIQANTLLDLLAIIKAFGVKKINTNTFFLNACNLFGYNCESVDLPSYLNIALSASEIQNINDYLSAQSINYKF